MSRILLCRNVCGYGCLATNVSVFIRTNVPTEGRIGWRHRWRLPSAGRWKSSLRWCHSLLNSSSASWGKNFFLDQKDSFFSITEFGGCWGELFRGKVEVWEAWDMLGLHNFQQSQMCPTQHWMWGTDEGDICRDWCPFGFKYDPGDDYLGLHL